MIFRFKRGVEMSAKKTKQLPKLQQEILALLRAREGRGGTSKDVEGWLARESPQEFERYSDYERGHIISDALRSLTNKKIITRTRRVATPGDRCLFLYTAPSAARQPAVPASNFAAAEMEKLQSAEIDFLRSEVARLTREIYTMNAATTAPPRGYNVFAVQDGRFIDDITLDEAITEAKRFAELNEVDYVIAETAAIARFNKSVTVEVIGK
jgi:hypothetical protein